MSGKRSAASLAMPFETAVINASGTSGTSSRIERGSSIICLKRMARVLSPSKGTVPVSMW